MSRLVVGRMFIHLQKTVEGMGIWKEGVRGGYIHTANSDSKQQQQTATANSKVKNSRQRWRGGKMGRSIIFFFIYLPTADVKPRTHGDGCILSLQRSVPIPVLGR